MTDRQTFHLKNYLYDLNFKYFQTTIRLEGKRKIINKHSLCETTRKQLTDINTNGQALIESIYSKAHLKTLGDDLETFKKTLDDPQGWFSGKNCEKSCFGDCNESCRARCKKSCKDCKGDCMTCEDNCEEDCLSSRSVKMARRDLELLAPALRPRKCT